MDCNEKQNVEYRTLVKCNSSLISQLGPNVLSLAEQLFSEFIIPDSIRTFVRDSNNLEEHKASKLVGVIQNKVKRHPHLFDKFVEIVDLELSQKEVVSELRDTLKSYGNCLDESADKTDRKIVKDFDEHIGATKDTVKKLRSDFKELAKSMKKLLIHKDKKNELKYSNFKEDFIYDLPESTRDQIQFYLEKKSDGISKAKNYDSLFMVLGYCWDYLNPYLLQHIINEFGGELKSDMNRYLHELEEFRIATDIETFWEAQDPVSREVRKPPPELNEVITHHDLSKRCTLQCIENIRLDLCLELRLCSFALYIAKIDQGSVVITWFVTPKVAEMFADLEQREGGSFKVLSGSSEEVANGEDPSQTEEVPEDFPQTGDIHELVSTYIGEDPPQIGDMHEEVSTYIGEDSPRTGDLHEEVSSSSNTTHPFKVRDVLAIYFPAPGSTDNFHEESFGRWIVGEPLYNLDTWQTIKQELESNRLAATGLKSSTRRYNPSSSGPGPVTHGVVSVYTTEENIDRVGHELIALVQHDIVYKTKNASTSGKYRHKGDQNFTLKTLFWNGGNPTTSSKKGHKAVWGGKMKDKWHLNIANSKAADILELIEKQCGYWCVECENENITDFWHIMRVKVESGVLGPVKMECPAKKRGKESTPVVLLNTVYRNVKDVESALRATKLLKSLSYVTTGTTHDGDKPQASPETLVKVPSLDR